MPLFNANIDLSQNQLLSAVVHSASAQPTSPSPVAGQIFYDTSVNQLQVYTGSAWEGLQTETAEGSLQFNAGLKIGRDASDLIDFTTNNQITFRVNSGDNVIFKASGEIEAASLDISGDADIDGTMEADALTIGGTNILTGGIVTTLGDIAQDTIRFISGAADDPMFIIENTADDATGPRLLLLKDRGAAGEDNDEVGEILFAGDNDAQEQTTYAKIVTKIADASNGVEGGKFEIRVASHDAELLPALTLIDGDAEDEVDAFIGSGAASVTSVAGTLTMGTTAAMGNTGLLTVGAQTGITATANLVTVGALNAGTITSGFGNIDNGSATFDTGAATVASLVLGGHSIDDIDITAEFVDADAHIMSSKAIGARFALKNADTTGTATNATNAAHVAIANTESGNEENELTFVENAAAGGANRGLESSAKATFNPGSGAITATTFVGKLTIGGHGLDDVNINTEFVNADDTLMSAKAIGHRFGLKAGSTSIVTTGVLNAGSINTSFGNINNGGSTITTTGLITGGSLDIDDVLINGSNIGHTDDTDLIALADGAVTVNGSLTVTGTTTTNNVETVSTSSGVIFEGGTADGHDATLKSVVAGADVTYTLPNVAGFVGLFAADPGTTTITSTPAELNKLDGATVVVGEINALDLGSTAIGNAIASKAVVLDSSKDFTGINSLGADNFVIGGHTINDVDLAGEFVDSAEHLLTSAAALDKFAVINADTTGTATNATNAAHVLVTDNENTDEENQITFIEGAGGGGANRGLEADGHLTYNPSSGTVSATIFKGNIDAVDGDFDGTLEADVLTVGGTNVLTGSLITTLGTISAGVWNGTKIADAYLSDNTAHLDTTQTFTGAKTFTNTVALTGTGRITGIDTVSAATDAASKTYVDAHVWNGNDITSGTVVSARLDADTAHLSGSQTFTGTKTLNSFKGTAGATVTNILDEDAMGSDSATALATQQSIKKYVDDNTAANREVVLVLNNSVSGVASSDNITYAVTHSLDSRNVMVEVIRNGANSGDFRTVYADVNRTSDDIVTIVFGSARTAGDYTVMIQKIG